MFSNLIVIFPFTYSIAFLAEADAAATSISISDFIEPFPNNLIPSFTLVITPFSLRTAALIGFL